MLGASDSGRFTGEEMHYTQRMDTIEEKKAADVEAIRTVLKERGAAGNLKHYLEKTGLTWSDGTAEYSNRTEESENSLSWLYQLLNGPGAGILYLWCQAYRILLLLMAFSGILLQISADRSHVRPTVSSSDVLQKRSADWAVRFLFQVCVITLLGGFCILYLLGRKTGLQLSLPPVSDSGGISRMGKSLPVLRRGQPEYPGFFI
jgi:hypothetical protein